MATRPVLSMNFYQFDHSSFVNPYQQMKRQAQAQKQQRVQRIEQKKKNIGKVIQNINQRLSTFFPDEEMNNKNDGQRQNNESNFDDITFSEESMVSVKKNKEKYSREYFDSLHQNLKDINELIDALDIDS